MWCPEVEIGPEDSILEAAAKVVRAYEKAGADLLPFDNLNTLLPTSAFCHFFQGARQGHRYVAVVNSRPWEESSILAVLNILLNLRMDPDPPGPPPLFRFHGAHPVAPVLLTLFGDTAASEFECRAALVVGYAVDLHPGEAFRLAAVAVHLLRECFGVTTSLADPDGDLRIAEVLDRWFPTGGFPEGGEPLNTFVTLGFLFGETLRARLPYLSRWVRIKDQAPWPVLVFGHKPCAEDTQGGEEEAHQIIFNPLATVVAVYQGGPSSVLRESADALEAKCEDVLGTIDEN